MCSRAFVDWCRDAGIDTSAVTPALIPIQSQEEPDERPKHHYRGLVAARPLVAGDALCVVPARLLLSATGSAARDPALGPLLLKAKPLLTHHQALCVHLLHEASKRPPASAVSAWAPYLRELPRRYTILAAWPPPLSGAAAGDALQAPHARRAQRRAARSARREWEGARPVLLEAFLGALGAAAASPPPRLASWRAWLWAHGAALSRTMYLPPAAAAAAVAGNTKSAAAAGAAAPAAAAPPPAAPPQADRAGCLTPFGDLLNHAAPRGAPWAPDPLEEIAGIIAAEPEAESEAGADTNQKGEEANEEPEVAGDGAFDAERGAYVLRTRRALGAGEEALLSYGRHTNLELLALYGFLLPPGATNPDDRAPLPRRHVRAAVAGGGDEGDGGGACCSSSSDDDEEGVEVGSSRDPLASHGGGGSWYVQAADGRPSWALFEELKGRAAAAAAAGAAAGAGAPPPSSSSSPPAALLLRQALTVERWLRAACLATLRELPTTAEEDEAWLAARRSAEEEEGQEERASGEDGDAGSRKKKDAEDDENSDDDAQHAAECLRLAVEWRLQYKRALLRCVARCDRALERWGKGGGGGGGGDDDDRRQRTKTTTAAAPLDLLLRRGRVVAFPIKTTKK
jgi:hypothetical protein